MSSTDGCRAHKDFDLGYYTCGLCNTSGAFDAKKPFDCGRFVPKTQVARPLPVVSGVDDVDVIERVDMVSVYVKNGQPVALLVSGTRRIEATLRPLVLGSLLAGIGMTLSTLLDSKN